MNRKSTLKRNRVKRKQQRNNGHDYFDRYDYNHSSDGFHYPAKVRHDCGCGHAHGRHHEYCGCGHHDEPLHDCKSDHQTKHDHDCGCNHHEEFRQDSKCNHLDNCGCNHHVDHHDDNCRHQCRRDYFVHFGCNRCNRNHDFSHPDNCCDCRCHLCLNLARLNDNLNFKLLRNKRRPLEISTVGNKRFRGKTKHVGIDYVDIKGNNGNMITILKDKIEYIDWKMDKNNQVENW